MNNLDFSFMADERYRQITERDYAELQRLNPENHTKAVIVLAGSVIEALLIDALVLAKVRRVSGLNLERKINEAANVGIISEARLTHAIRNYRNLIHPEKEVKQRIKFNWEDAELALAAMKIVIREIASWALKQKREERISGYLNKLNQDQKDLLLLFATEKPPGQYEHPFLKHSVYAELKGLIENGIVNKEHIEDLNSTQEKITIDPEAIELVQQLILNGNAQREMVILDWSNIEASNSGGSGAPVINWR